MNNLLEVQGLSVSLPQSGVAGARSVLSNVSFAVSRGAVLGIVGGSGSGKTTLGLALLGLLPSVMVLAGGQVIFDGRELTKLSPEEWRALRGAGISMAFQEPMSAFDPVMTIGAQIQETVLAHEKISSAAARERALEALRLSGLADPVRIAAAYAFELSGGLRQRAMIAQALACRPALLIADEPTSSLDVNTQEKILELFQELRRSLGLSIIIITHDLGVVRRTADEVVVLCRGVVVEQGKVAQMMSAPRADYTRLLLEAEG
ncbi:MAG: ABC transporter ATP-binding protein [Candidatus Omnitrophica bacterium]|nr:ABC transporter ATP-binding protein [Candidatus Omnitrophota bacterium]